jgi:hypothetical protein
LDVSDPDSVVEVGYIDIDARGVFVKYPYAYLALRSWERDGLKILDVSRPDSIMELGYFPIWITDEVFVQDTIAYVASAFEGVYIVNVADPENPTEISRFPTLDMATDVHVSGDYMYVAAGYAGVSVVDVSDPRNPFEVDYSVVAYGDQLHVVEPYLYLGGDNRGVRVLDISDPHDIYEVGYYTGIYTDGIYSDGEYIYVGTSMQGFYIFEFSPSGIVDGREPVGELPRGFALHQNYPNPFNPRTTITYEVPGESEVEVSLVIYDLRGRRVRTLVDDRLSPGTHSVVWDGRASFGSPVPSGVYLYRLKAGSFTSTRKMTLLE